MSQAKEKLEKYLAKTSFIGGRNSHYEDYIKELEEENKKLRCCGNCTYYELTQELVGSPCMQENVIKHECYYHKPGCDYQQTDGYNYSCEHWQFNEG